MKKGLVIGGMAIAVTLSAAAAWWWLEVPAPPAAPLAQSPAASAARSNAPPGTPPADSPASAGAAAESSAPQAPVDYRAKMRASSDYWEFAQSLLAAAKQGDAAAQFYLSNALLYCDSLYDWYFVEHLPGGAIRHRTIDEALQFTASRPVFTADDVRKLQTRCQRLRSAGTPPFGSAREWLDAAIQARYPPAQTIAALDRAMQARQQPTPEATRAMREDAQRLALEAARTRDPEVIARIGEVASNLETDDYAESQRVPWVWRLAACLRETNCDSNADWFRLYCNIDTQCQPFETPQDIIRRKTGNDYDEIERRARELNEKIDAGTLEAGDI